MDSPRAEAIGTAAAASGAPPPVSRPTPDGRTTAPGAAGPPAGRPDARPADEELLARLGAGDPQGLDLLVRRYWEPIFRYARRATGSPDAAADIAQDVFCRLWERRARWRPQGSLRALLFRLARNAVVSRERGRRARERALHALATGTAAPRAPADAAEHAELQAALERAIAHLPPRRREVFLLRMVDGLSYEEIAVAMGTSRQTVANQLCRALASLRATLGPLLAD